MSLFACSRVTLIAAARWGLPFFGGLAAMSAIFISRQGTTASNAPPSEVLIRSVAPDTTSAQSRAEELSLAFRAAAQAVLPTVVQIRAGSASGNLEKSSPWHDSRPANTPQGGLFLDGPEFSGRHFPEDSPESTLGSGINIHPSGIVLTNNHLLEGVDEVFIQTADDRRFPVVEVRTDAGSDLALLRFDSQSSVPAARLGDSDHLQIGDWVLTIGNPLDLRQTVSAGIISATGRRLEGAGDVGLLQTDAAINPGSSGGALVNLRGEVVGITTGIASEDGGYQGIGFAIPANLAMRVIGQLPKRGVHP